MNPDRRRGPLRPRRCPLRLICTVAFLTAARLNQLFTTTRCITANQPTATAEMGWIADAPRLKEGTYGTKAKTLSLLWIDASDDNDGTVAEANKAPTMPDETDWLLSMNQAYQSESHYEQYGQLIPKIIHKVILNDNGQFDKTIGEVLNMTRNFTSSKAPQNGSLLHAHLTWKMMNPEYKIRYFNLHLSRSYLQRYFNPIFLRAFDCIEAFAGKANLFRYLLIYREGGYYSDWKQECKEEGLLDWLSKDNATWFSAWDAIQNRRRKENHAMQNALFGAPPQSPILAEAIRTALHNIQGRLDLKNGTTALDMTGIYVLGQSFNKVKNSMDPNDIHLGKYIHAGGMRFFYGPTGSEKCIVVHKCDKCGKDQNWSRGNNYKQKHKLGEYFCPDAPALFHV